MTGDPTPVTPPGPPLRMLEAAINGGILARAVEQKRLGATLGRISNALNLAKLHTRASALQPVAITLSPDPTRATDVIGRLKQLAGVANGLAEAESEEDLKALVEKIGRADEWLRVVTRDLAALWDQYIHIRFHPSRQLGELLQRFSGTRQIGTRLAELAASTFELKARFPPSSLEVASLKSAMEQRDQLIQEIKGASGPPEVLPFLEKLVKESATLGDLTPGLLDWLSHHGARGLLRIRL